MSEEIFVALVYSGAWVGTGLIGYRFIKAVETYRFKKWTEWDAVGNLLVAMFGGIVGMCVAFAAYAYYYEAIQKEKRNK